MPSTKAIIEEYDAVPVMCLIPEPHVEWFSPEEFQQRYGYYPGRIHETLSDDELTAVVEKRRLRITETRMEAFDRLARIWNGECAGPGHVHLLADKVPSWSDLFGDLDQEQLDTMRRSVERMDQEYIDAFGDEPWFEAEHHKPGWLKTSWIARQRADYDIEQRSRVLINEREDLPTLRGDPFEGLLHRTTVGVEAARATFLDNRRVETYVPVGDYVVDLLEHDRATGTERVGEVLTNHNNNELYRSTWVKIFKLERPAILVFDNRETARRVLNHWQKWGVDVPGAPFESSLNFQWTRKKFAQAASDPQRFWPIEDILTVTSAWDMIDSGEQSPGRRELVSLDW